MVNAKIAGVSTCMVGLSIPRIVPLWKRLKRAPTRELLPAALYPACGRKFVLTPGRLATHGAEMRLASLRNRFVLKITFCRPAKSCSQTYSFVSLHYNLING